MGWDWIRKITGMPQPGDLVYSRKIDKALPFIFFGLLIALGVYAVYVNSLNVGLTVQLHEKEAIISALKSACSINS